MDRLTTGRRHVRAGAVTVNELLIKQASPTPCTDSSPMEPDDDATATTATITAVPAAHRRQQAKGAQLAKLASLGVAGAVLCGAVTIASMVAHQRRENAGPAARLTIQITGEQALLPDKLNETLPVAAAPVEPAAPSNTPLVVEAAPAPTEEQATEPPADRKTGNSGTTASADTGHAEIGPATDLDLVREFYENLPQSPSAAFGLLSGELTNTSLGEFLASWSTVSSIDNLQVARRADGVLATVRMRLHNGGRLRIQQLLTVAESPRRIVGVQLLSAQRN